MLVLTNHHKKTKTSNKSVSQYFQTSLPSVALSCKPTPSYEDTNLMVISQQVMNLNFHLKEYNNII